MKFRLTPSTRRAERRLSRVLEEGIALTEVAEVAGVSKNRPQVGEALPRRRRRQPARSQLGSRRWFTTSPRPSGSRRGPGDCDLDGLESGSAWASFPGWHPRSSCGTMSAKSPASSCTSTSRSWAGSAPWRRAPYARRGWAREGRTRTEAEGARRLRAGWEQVHTASTMPRAWPTTRCLPRTRLPPQSGS